jgi:hypothetical protein
LSISDIPPIGKPRKSPLAIRGFIASREKPMDIVGVVEGEWLGALAGCGVGGPK